MTVQVYAPLSWQTLQRFQLLAMLVKSIQLTAYFSVSSLLFQQAKQINRQFKCFCSFCQLGIFGQCIDKKNLCTNLLSAIQHRPFEIHQPKDTTMFLI
ncbi:hypothetical protein [Sunxiuqinia sp. sy24]|uniref:hypothetical protein n=1 Tax=Sunxiuqinia sp. sy24 TaxID=3461495 RepID=UPI0040461222